MRQTTNKKLDQAYDTTAGLPFLAVIAARFEISIFLAQISVIIIFHRNSTSQNYSPLPLQSC
jgi:hypothetical protein